MEHWDQFSQKFLFQKSRKVGKSFGWIWTQIPIQKKHETTTQTARIHESRAIGFRPSPWFFKIKWDDSDAPWIGLSPSTLQLVNFWSPVVGHLLRTFPFFFIWVLVLQRKFWRNVSGWRFGNTSENILLESSIVTKASSCQKFNKPGQLSDTHQLPLGITKVTCMWMYVVFVLFSRYVTGGKLIL